MSTRPRMFTYNYSLVIVLNEDTYGVIYCSFCIKRKAFNSICHRKKVTKIITPYYPYDLFDISII